MHIEDFMSRKVIAADVNNSLKEITSLMKENDIGFIPIHEEHKIIGVLTDRDIALNIVGNQDSHHIRSYLKENIIKVSKEESIEDALNIMASNKVKRLLVTDDKKVVGILSLSDLLEYEDEKVLSTIKTIFKKEPHLKEEDVEIDAFYL